MNPAQLLAYLGPALLYAALATVAVFGLLRLFGARPDPRPLPTLFLALFFLALTHFPLPDPASLDCSSGGVAPVLRPFATLDHVARIWRYSQVHPEAGITPWIGNKVLQAAAMNFLLPALIGAVFVRHAGRRPWAKALGLALLLSGGAEIAQLTGFFGLAPCPWRTFEIDDLILNISGLMAGFALMRHWQMR